LHFLSRNKKNLPQQPKASKCWFLACFLMILHKI
jgi:hypothetical protein